MFHCFCLKSLVVLICCRIRIPLFWPHSPLTHCVRLNKWLNTILYEISYSQVHIGKGYNMVIMITTNIINYQEKWANYAWNQFPKKLRVIYIEPSFDGLRSPSPSLWFLNFCPPCWKIEPFLVLWKQLSFFLWPSSTYGFWLALWYFINFSVVSLKEKEKKLVMMDRWYTSINQYLQPLSILHLCYAWESLKQKRAVTLWSIPALSFYIRVNYLVSRILLLYYFLDV